MATNRSLMVLRQLTLKHRDGAVAELIERPSKGPGSRCNTADVSLNPCRGIKLKEKILAAPSVEYGNKRAVWELEKNNGTFKF